MFPYQCPHPHHIFGEAAFVSHPPMQVNLATPQLTTAQSVSNLFNIARPRQLPLRVYPYKVTGAFLLERLPKVKLLFKLKMALQRGYPSSPAAAPPPIVQEGVSVHAWAGA